MSERTTVDVLRAARERISPSSRWTRGVLARDEKGFEVAANDPHAVCWCSVGALLVEGRGGLDDVPAVLLAEAMGCDVADFNDGEHASEEKPRPAPARHRRVLAAFDRAIALAEKA